MIPEHQPGVKMRYQRRINLNEAGMRRILGEVVERVMLNYLRSNFTHIIESLWTGDIGSIQYLRPTPHHINRMNPEVGTIETAPGMGLIHGWHGDMAVLLNTQLGRKKAAIFEIKFGKIMFTRSEHRFFQSIIFYPEKYLAKLTEARVFLVNAWGLDLEGNSLDFVIRPYRTEGVQG